MAFCAYQEANLLPSQTRRQTALFQRYKRDSTAAAHWLKTRDRRSNFYAESTMEHDAADSENEDDDFLQEEDDDDEAVGPNKLVDRLLNIAPEANLIVECKDIQDEIGILATVLRQQKDVLSDMERTVFKFTGGFLDDTRRQELTAKVSRQQQSIDISLTELKRMDRQLEDVNTNLAPLLDLKSKHANALEARFQRDQAQATTRQGQIIMIFTIVTIVFLPMSFMASFFAINIIELPHNSSNGGSGLPLAYVAKYMFGIGFAVSIPLISIAFLITDMEGWIQIVKRKMRLSTKKKKTKSRLVAPTSPGQEQIVEKNGMIEEPRMSMDWTFGRIRRWDTGGTERSRITLDLERG
jgi:Mg2+ and Co2+ transporter CorA